MKKLLDELVQKVKSQAGSQMTNYSSVQEFSGLPEVDFTGRAGFTAGGKNKVPKKVGYVANEYTGRSRMMYGGMKKKKKMRGGYAHGGKHEMSRTMYGHGGYASVKDMEKACASKTVKNTMRQKYEENK